MANLLFILSAAVTLAASAFANPVREWREPGLQINVAQASLDVRGHVASTANGERLLAGIAVETQTEFWRHIALPAYWQQVSADLFAIALLLQSGQAILTRDEIKLSGFVLEHAGIDAQLETFQQSLPDGLRFEANLQALSGQPPVQSCTILRGSLLLDDLLFDRNSSSIRGGDIARLNQVADFLRRCTLYHLKAVGHADGIGSDRDSRVVSKRRADAVTAYLQSLDVPVDRLTALGEGKTAPVASNATWEGRNLNRRVTLELYSVASSSAGP